MNSDKMPRGKSSRISYYHELAADYSFPGLVSPEVGDKLIRLAEELANLQDRQNLPSFNIEDQVSRTEIERENKEWWPTHCEALRQGRTDLLTAEYRDTLVYFCQDGPFYGRGAGTNIESIWWQLLSQTGVTMCWPIVMFHGEVVYFEWKCVDDITNETTAKGNVTFLRRGHCGGVYLKTEQLTFYRDVQGEFFK
jgi:hypothetical protein